MLTNESVRKGTVCLLLLLSLLFGIQGQTQSRAADSVQDDQRLNEAKRANDEAQAAYYRAQTAKLAEPYKPKTFWQSVAENPASVLGVLGALVAAFVGLFSLYKNQRLAIASQYDTQFYEALKRFGERDSARLRSSAVGLLTEMANRNVSKGWFQQNNNSGSKFSTVLNQLAAGSRLEENRVVLNTIKDALMDLGSIEPLKAMEVLYKANRDLQNDLKAAIQNYSFHFMEKDADGTDTHEDEAPLKISPNVWPTLEWVTGFNSYLLYDWFSSVTKNDHDQSARAEVESMTAEKKSEHRRSTLEQAKITANQLHHNVEVCCSTLIHLTKRTRTPNGSTSTSYSAQPFGKLHPAAWSVPRLSSGPLWGLNGIFLVSGNLKGLDLTSLDERFALEGAFLHEVDLSSSRLIGTNLSSARMIGSKLIGAKMKGANLSEAILEGAILDGADLSNASLLNANLWHAHINNESVLQGTQWWRANFFNHYQIVSAEWTAVSGGAGKELEIDSALLAELFSRFEPDDLSEAHESVKKYKEITTINRDELSVHSQ